ncbi:hypothetical protein [Azospirillum argentinense]
MDDERLMAMEARVMALVQFQCYVMRRLGVDDAALHQWWEAWRGGDLTDLLDAQNLAVGTAKGTPKAAAETAEPDTATKTS